MRTAGLPNFRKLYGKFEEDLLPGTYEMDIQNNYDVSSYDGKKYFALVTTNAFGGKNYFMSAFFLTLGGLCVAFAIVFVVIHTKRARRRLD